VKNRPNAYIRQNLLDRLVTEARICGAAAMLNDGRTAHAKFLKRMASLLMEAADALKEKGAGTRREEENRTL
jgi:hypothetical protein